MTSIPRVSVVIPTYNHARFLGEALRSVIAQTTPDWEAIVVNNFSEDDTEAVVAGLNDPRIQLINFRNRGVIAASRNQGIGRARGEWVAFLDSDDAWMPRKLELSLAAANGADVVGTALLVEQAGAVVREQKSGPAARARYRALLYNGSCLTPSATMVRRAMLEAVGRFNEDPAFATGEDHDLWLKLAGHGARFCFIDDALSRYRLHEDNQSALAARHLGAALAILDHHYARLADRTWVDAVMFRRCRARYLYSAGRTLQRLGRPAEALAYFGRAFAAFPLMGRLHVAALASVVAAAFNKR